jgi:hypothetical protein
MTGLRSRDFNFGIAARRRGVDCGNNLRHMRFDDGPAPFAQNDNRDLAAGKVLLIADIAVRGNDDLEPCGFGYSQKFAVSQSVPSPRELR